MTAVTLCPDVAASGAMMPLELLVKAKSKRRTAGLAVPDGMRVSLQYSEKGSYRTENILRYFGVLVRPLD